MVEMFYLVGLLCRIYKVTPGGDQMECDLEEGVRIHGKIACCYFKQLRINVSHTQHRGGSLLLNAPVAPIKKKKEGEE